MSSKELEYLTEEKVDLLFTHSKNLFDNTIKAMREEFEKMEGCKSDDKFFVVNFMIASLIERMSQNFVHLEDEQDRFDEIITYIYELKKQFGQK